MAESIELRKDGEIAEVLLNRPETFNAFDLDMVELFSKCLIHLAGDDSVSVVVISGKGRAFCAGGDLKWVSSFTGGPAESVGGLFDTWILPASGPGRDGQSTILRQKAHVIRQAE